MKYFYPAVIEKTKEGYEVYFPDIKGCATSGDSLQEALLNAEDALSLMLWDMEEKQDVIPVASETNAIKCRKNEIVNLIPADTMEYRRLYDNKAVKKTLSIPKWLDTLAQRKNVNFSNVLQKGLMREIGCL